MLDAIDKYMSDAQNMIAINETKMGLPGYKFAVLHNMKILRAYRAAFKKMAGAGVWEDDGRVAHLEPLDGMIIAEAILKARAVESRRKP